MKIRQAIQGCTLLVAGVLAGCEADQPDAWGNFEATEVTVSTETGGRLLAFAAREGERIESKALVAVVDTVPVTLEIAELAVQLQASETRRERAEAEVQVLEAQLHTAEEELARVQRLHTVQAATSADLNRTAGEVSVLREQITAGRLGVKVTADEGEAIRARNAQLLERRSRNWVLNPVAGTVLRTFAESGEFAQVGRPLYTVASLDTLTLRAYLSGTQLSGVTLGQSVDVRIDGEDGGGLVVLPGRVSWIASEAEFTPTPIQTRAERVNLVYAIKVRVANPEGRLKIGMPGEVLLTPGARTGGG